MVSIYSMTIAIRSSNYYDRFYPQIHLAYCTYVQSTNVCDIYKTIELIFLKVSMLKNVKEHLENVVYVNSIIF